MRSFPVGALSCPTCNRRRDHTFQPNNSDFGNKPTVRCSYCENFRDAEPGYDPRLSFDITINIPTLESVGQALQLARELGVSEDTEVEQDDGHLMVRVPVSNILALFDFMRLKDTLIETSETF